MRREPVYDTKRKRYRYPRWNLSYWDLRVVQTLKGDGLGRAWFDVREVFYDTNDVPRLWSSAIDVAAESVAGLRYTHRLIARAFRLPTLMEAKRRGVDVLVPMLVTGAGQRDVLRAAHNKHLGSPIDDFKKDGTWNAIKRRAATKTARRGRRA
jgi:hypothetical protein